MPGDRGNMSSQALKHPFPTRLLTVLHKEPVRALLMPKQSMSINRESVGVCHLDESVSLGKAEAPLFGMQRQRLHAVLRSHCIEVCKQESALRRIQFGARDCGPHRKPLVEGLSEGVLFLVLQYSKRPIA